MKKWNNIFTNFWICLLFPFLSSAQIIQHRIDSLNHLYQQSKNDSSKVNLLNDQTIYFLRLRNYRAADSLINIQTQISKRSNYVYGLFNAYLLRGKSYAAANKFKDALPAFTDARKLIPLLPFKYDLQKQLAKLNYNEAVYFILNLQTDSALTYLQKAKRVIQQQQASDDDKQLLCAVFTFYSHAYAQKEKYDSAVKYITKALQIAEQLNNDLIKRDVYWGYMYLLFNEGLFQQEIKYLQQSAAIEFKYGMYSDYALHTFNVGLAYANMGDDTIADYYYSRSISNVKQYADKDNYILSLQEYAQNLVNLHQLNKANIVIKEALSLENLSRLTFTNFEVLLQLCDILHEEKKYNEEWSFLKKTDTLIASSKLPSCTISLKQQEIKYYEATGNYKAALNTLKDLNAIKDSVRKKSVEKNLAELNTKYEAAEKDRQITILNANERIAQSQISKQHILNISLVILFALSVIAGFAIYKRIQLKRKTEREIAELEKVNQLQQVRNKISRDMHDDIGASISKIGILSQHAKKQLESNNTNSALDTYNKISAQTIEMINGLRTFIWATNPQYDELTLMLGFMRNYIADFFDDTNIRYIINFPDIEKKIKINPELKRNLFLVLKESLNNIIKHSSASEVSIYFFIDEKRYRFEITDNGIGIHASENKPFTNGLKIMKNRAQEIRGLFSINSNQPSGTRIQLEGQLFQ